MTIEINVNNIIKHFSASDHLGNIFFCYVLNFKVSNITFSFGGWGEGGIQKTPLHSHFTQTFYQHSKHFDKNHMPVC